ncbi:hypothetical protein OH77DRAFT_1429744 [Trametes cingulata]|nr:hypothetical protein OH77DRAFT_1429744 [Trametes cingulata]
MKLPYFQILALTFFRFLVSARALPSGPSSGARGGKGEDTGMIAGAAVKLPQKAHEAMSNLRARGIPGIPGVHVMKNSDESRPFVPVDNYQADISRLTGGEQ